MDNKTNVKLSITEECFYNNGKIILNSLSLIEKDIRDSLNRSCNLKTIERNEKQKPSYIGIDAKDLNRVLRDGICNIFNIKNETHVENGIFYHDSREGFDFSI